MSKNRIIGYRKSGAPIYAILGASQTLDRLRVERQACIDFVASTLAEVERASRDLSDTEQESLKRQQDRVKELDAQIAPLEDFEKLRAADQSTVDAYRPTAQRSDQGEQRGAGERGEVRGLGVQTNRRPHKYESAGHVIVDRLHAFDGDQRAADRLESNGLDVPGRLGEQMGQKRAAGAESRASVVTDDTPPLLPDNIRGEIINEIDASRPFMESQGVGTLSDKPGKKWSRPKVTQHVQVGEQTAELQTLATRKFTLGEIEFTKQTAGGYVDISRQEIDWTDPSAWNAITKDFQEQYEIQTESMAVAKFVASLDSTGTEVAGDTTLQGWATALYAAALEVWGNVKALPDVVYTSLDMWAKLGPITEAGKLIFSNQGQGGDGGLNSFAGNLFDLPRIVIPNLTAGTIAVGRKSKFECYEQRLGFLTSVNPSVLGITLAYGGYVANGYVSTGGFAKVVNAVAG